MGAAPEAAKSARGPFAIEGDDAYGERCMLSTVENDSFFALLSWTLRRMYLYNIYAIVCVGGRFLGSAEERPDYQEKLKMSSLNMALSTLHAASYTLKTSVQPYTC